MASVGMKQIEDRIGASSSGGKPVEAELRQRLDPSLASSLALRADLKMWVEKNGITRRSAQSAVDNSLIMAYAHGAYLRSWRNRVNPQWDLLGGSDDDSSAGDALSEEASPPPKSETRSVSQADIDEVTKSIVAALQPELRKQVDERFEGLRLSGETQRKIEELARSATLAALRENLPTTIEIKNITTNTIVNLGLQHEQFPQLLRAVQAKDANGYSLNIWLTGPAGSGKTTAAVKVAAALASSFTSYRDNGPGKDWDVVDAEGNVVLLGLRCSGPFGSDGSLDADYKVIGFKDGNGHFNWTTFLRCFVYGGVYIADEIDNWAPSALLALNSALANGWINTPAGMLTRHKDCIIIACANTWGLGATNDYVGRTRLDAASLDRFQPKINWRVDEKLERAVAQQHGSELGISWHNIVLKARANAKRQGLKILITPRATFFGISLLKQGFSANEVLDMTILAGLSEEQANALGIRGISIASGGIDIDEEIAMLVRRGHKIEAIRLYREHYGTDLIGAKTAIEDIERLQDEEEAA